MKTVLSLLVLMMFGRTALSEDLKIYAAAALKAPLGDIVNQYEAASGNKVTFVLDTAGATEQRFREDPQAALLITTVPVISDAEKTGKLKGGTSRPLGASLAGIAFVPGSPKPDVSTPEKLKAALLSAKRIAFSDPARGATVGIHFMKVIDSLGVKDEVLRKSTVAKDGIETMRLVLEEKYDLGVTQVSEILQANRNAVAGPFPKQFELATTYALWYRNDASGAAKAFVTLLTSPATRAKLSDNGISPVEAGPGQAQAAKPDSPQVRADIEKAKALAGTTWALEEHVICDLPMISPAVDPGPQKLFDNLYAIPGAYSAGSGVVYLITTPAGIIQIDSGLQKDVETVYLPGMKKLGFDPADVKVVIITHGHADHFGGAPYLQEHYKPRVYMSAPDWDFVQLAPPPAQGPKPVAPKVDLFVTDGQPIVLGDEKVTPVLIPGHTPGSLGLIFPVKDGGKSHMVGIVGGGMLPQGSPDQMKVFLHSLDHFEEWTKKMKVDVELQNHPIMDGFADKLAALRARKPGEPHPFVVGQENYSRFVEVMHQCVQVYIDRRLQ